MKTTKTVLALVIGLALTLTSASTVLADDDGGNAKITPVVTVDPTLFAAGKASNAYLCVSNGSPSNRNPKRMKQMKQRREEFEATHTIQQSKRDNQ